MTKVFTDVQVFMSAAGQTTTESNIPQSGLYHKLICEEFNEYIQAKNANDEVEEPVLISVIGTFNSIILLFGYLGGDINCSRLVSI